jgi:hypothetical protein
VMPVWVGMNVATVAVILKLKRVNMTTRAVMY